MGKLEIANTLQLDCESSEAGIAALREEYQILLDAGVGLEESNHWLDSEEEILSKLPLLEKQNIKVNIRSYHIHKELYLTKRGLTHLALGLESNMERRWWLAGCCKGHKCHRRRNEREGREP
jgi:hypothetical protein